MSQDAPLTRTPPQEARLSQFAALPRRRADLLLLGDSLTEHGLWSEWLPELSVVNRGIGGDTVPGVLARLDRLPDAAAVSVLAGTNDLGRGADPAVVASGFRLLVEVLRDTAPRARLLVTSIPPRTREYRDRILSLNVAYRAVTEHHDGEWIDLWPALADDDGALAARFTYDGLHFTGPAYHEWANAIAIRLGLDRS